MICVHCSAQTSLSHILNYSKACRMRCPATACSDGNPWNSPVAVRFDDTLTMYWVSDKASQHSKNIAHNPEVFVVLFDTAMAEGEGIGLYLHMYAELLHKPQDIIQAQRVYDASFFIHAPRHLQFGTACPQDLYKAMALRIWHNDSMYRNSHYADCRAVLMPRPGE